MKPNNARFPKKVAGRRIDLSKAASRIMPGSLALLIGLTAIGTPLPAAPAPAHRASILQADSPAVYLLDSKNIPVLASNAWIDEGGIYTDGGFVGILDANNSIRDANANIIGYVVGYVTPPDRG